MRDMQAASRAAELLPDTMSRYPCKPPGDKMLRFAVWGFTFVARNLQNLFCILVPHKRTCSTRQGLLVSRRCHRHAAYFGQRPGPS